MLTANRKAIQLCASGTNTHTHTHTNFLRFTLTILNVQTHAVDVCMSCQPLLKLFLSSLRGEMPSFCLRSACCFSLDAKTCFSVLISSSSWTQTRQKNIHPITVFVTSTPVVVLKLEDGHVGTYFGELLMDLLSLLLRHDGVV